MNTYIQKIQSISSNSKYTKWYCSIINNALIRAQTKKQAKQILGYVETHHIVPKCFFDSKEFIVEFPEDKNNKNNLVHLTAREHFICHWLLTKMSIEKFKYKMQHALFSFATKSSKRPNRLLTPKQYDIAKKFSAVCAKTTNWYNNGIVEIMTLDCPDGFSIGRLPVVYWNKNGKNKRSAVSPGETWIKGKISSNVKWWHCGALETQQIECPGPNWVRGRSTNIAVMLKNNAKTAGIKAAKIRWS
jgi:hypothetical protein